MQYALASGIRTHPTYPHSLKTFQVSSYGNWADCSWVGEAGGKNFACNANDKSFRAGLGEPLFLPTDSPTTQLQSAQFP